MGEQAWIDSILDKAFPENPKPQTEPYLRYEDLLLPEDAEKYRRKQMAQKQASLNNGSALTGFSAPIAQNNQLRSAGDIKVQQAFSQPTNPVNTNNNLVSGFGNSLKKKHEFPDLGKTIDYKNDSFAPVYDDEKREMLKKYLVDPNRNIVIDEMEGSWVKKKPKYEAEEPVDYEEMPDEDEDTTLEELETSEETEEGNSKEEPEETSSELQDEPYLRYEDLLPDETDEEREAREARELEAFNKAWDKANGVEEKDADGVLTGGAADMQKTPLLQGYIEKTNKNNLTLGEKILDKILQNKIFWQPFFIKKLIFKRINNDDRTMERISFI